MKLVYSRQALADIEAIATYYSENASPTIARSIEHVFLAVIARVRRNPDSAPRVTQRPGVRCVTVVRYRFEYFIAPAAIQSKFCTFGMRRDDPSGSSIPN